MLKSFSDDWTKILTVNFVKNQYFEKCTENRKNLYEFWKINKFTWKIGHLIIYWNFYYQFVNNFAELLLCKIKNFGFLHMVGFFRFLLNRKVLKFWSNKICEI